MEEKLYVVHAKTVFMEQLPMVHTQWYISYDLKCTQMN
ncbi:hypothetical protein mvi_1027 [Megavirus vitis]|nr:hypothetical protein mvi_1027 [Megavirus vitis]